MGDDLAFPDDVGDFSVRCVIENRAEMGSYIGGSQHALKINFHARRLSDVQENITYDVRRNVRCGVFMCGEVSGHGAGGWTAEPAAEVPSRGR